MSAFRTEINITRQPFIDHKTKTLTAGSCFSDNLGHQLANNKFNVMVNPFGVAYNPIAIHRTLLDAFSGTPPAEHLYIEREGVWSHFNYHSRWSSVSRAALANSLTTLVARAGEWLKNTNVLFITYGTAWVYQHKATNEIVSNCHKVPTASFDRRLLSHEDILIDFRQLYDNLKNINPEVKIILTVSPVRHVRDTPEGNQVSKSVVRLACHHITQSCNDVLYFPAYEIVLDDLRDYRFYDSDLIHPSSLAQDYIWSKFKECYFTDSAISLSERWSSIRKALDHRAFHPGTLSHQKFVNDTISKLKGISSELDVQREIEDFSRTNQI